MSTAKEIGDGEIDFSDGELVEMNADVAGREPGASGKKKRATLRVPADEVRRPDDAAPIRAQNTEPSIPAFPDDPTDDLVEHAFSNGGRADGVVPAAPDFLAAVEGDAHPFLDKYVDEDNAPEMQVERELEAEPEDDTDKSAIPQTINDEPTAPLPQRQANPGSPLAALARAVAASPAPTTTGWAQPTGAVPKPPAKAMEAVQAVDEPVWSSAPPPTPSERPVVVAEVTEPKVADPQAVSARALAAAVVKPRPKSDDTPMELEGDDMEEVDERDAPSAGFEARGKTPIVPPPPLDAGAPKERPRSLTPLPPPTPQDTTVPIATAPATVPQPPSSTGPIATASPPPPPTAMPASASQPIAVTPPPPPAEAKEANGHAAPPPVPTASPPPAPQPRNRNDTPLVSPPSPAAADAPALRTRKKRRTKQWYEEVFDDDYLRTLPFLTQRQTEREAGFVAESLGVPPGGALLDVACGYGRHAMELAQKGFKITGLDLSLPLLIRAADTARRSSLNINFIHGDMREMTFENEFDAAYCMFTSFGYFDDDTNRKVAANLQRALKPGGKVLIDVVNRDYLCRDLPTRVWWQGEGCVVLEEVDFNYFSSRLQVQRSIIFEDGRQVEQEISIRAYSLHEIGKVLHHSGFRVTEVSGGLSLRGKFFGANSRQLIVLAEKKSTP